jgi:multidrug resistance protein MdtO
MSVAIESLAGRGGTFFEIVNLLRPRPGRLGFAARLALICALTTLVVEVYQTPDPALTVYVAFFLNKPDRVESLILDVALTILITVIVGLLMLLSMLVIDAPLWRVVVMGALSVGFLTLAFASKLRPLAGIIVLIVGYGLDVIATFQFGELATRAVLYVWLFITIPAGVSVVVNLLIAPPPRRLAERALASRLRLAAAMLRGPDDEIRRGFSEHLHEGSGEIQAWLKLAGVEKTSPPRDLAALRQATQSTIAILAWVDVMDRTRGELLPRPLLDQLAETLEALAQVLCQGRYPLDIALDAHVGDSPLPAYAAELWSGIRNLLHGFAEPPAPLSTPAPPAAPPAGFFMPDLLTNPEYVRHALKTTGAAMFCYALYTLLDWRGIHTCFITCYIVSLGTSAETIEKFVLRIAGCLIGAAAGLAAIVYVIPSLTSIGALLAVVFSVALASAWVAAGSARISYAGFQIAFAFFLCVIQGSSPAFDLSIARDRIVGILLGNLVVYLFFTRLWPVSVAKRIDPAITAVLRRLSAMAAATTAATRHTLGMEIQGALGNIEQDLDLLRYEPAAIRPAEVWLRARRRAAREIASLQTPLLWSAVQECGSAADFGARLEHVANTLAATPGTSVPQTDRATRRAAPARGPLDTLISAHLSRLETALDPDASAAQVSGGDRSTSHAAA